MSEWIALQCGQNVIVFRANAAIEWGDHEGEPVSVFPVYNLRGERGYAMILGAAASGEVLAHWFNRKSPIPTYISERARNSYRLAWKVWNAARAFPNED